MKQVILNLIVLAAFIAAGCSSDTPIEASSSEHDKAVATIIAGSIGYESNGLSAILADMVTAGTGGTLRSGNGSVPAALVVTQNDSTFDPSTLSQNLVLACQRNLGDTYSEWELSYAIQYAGMRGTGEQQAPADAVAAETHADGTYRNSMLTAHGKSMGKIGFVEPGAGRSAWLGGEYTWEGTSTIQGKEESYGDVSIALSWNRLHVKCSNDGPLLNGRCDVTVSANGPQGAIVKNGSITFDGNRALLSIGGRQYKVNVRSPEQLAEA